MLFMISGKPAFDKITGYIQKAKDTGAEIIFGGSGSSIFWYKFEDTKSRGCSG